MANWLYDTLDDRHVKSSLCLNLYTSPPVSGKHFERICRLQFFGLIILKENELCGLFSFALLDVRHDVPGCLYFLPFFV